jgi:hypothetical protein
VSDLGNIMIDRSALSPSSPALRRIPEDGTIIVHFERGAETRDPFEP